MFTTVVGITLLTDDPGNQSIKFPNLIRPCFNKLPMIISDDLQNLSDLHFHHAVEFCGFAFEILLRSSERTLITKLESILINSLELGMMGPGIALSVSASTGKAPSPYYPWWSLPEAIRACALGMQSTGSNRLLPYLQRSDALSFITTGDRKSALPIKPERLTAL